MTSSAPPRPAAASRYSKKPIYMVLGCTVFAAAAQVLLKFGTQHPMPALSPGNPVTWMPFVLGLLGNAPLIFGYALHAGNALLLILALRDGELSLLYPIYALSYVWVNLLSMYYFAEKLNAGKTAGIVLVIAGVALMGRTGNRA